MVALTAKLYIELFKENINSDTDTTDKRSSIFDSQVLTGQKDVTWRKKSKSKY